jgi:vitamin B12 transporter
MMPSRPAVALLALGLSSTAVAAQTRPDSTPPLLPAVSVTATRTDFVANAPLAATTVFSAADLRATGTVLVADLLRQVPGASFLPGGSFGAQSSLFLRGGETDYTLVLVDGVPLNTPGGYVDFGQLTVDNVERVEVLRGPASLLYGSDAVAGVVQIFTTQGGADTRASAVLGAGNFDARRLEGNASGALGAWRWSAGGARHTTAGILPFNSGFRNDVLSAAGGWTGARSSLGATLRYTDHRFRYPTDGGGQLADSNTVTTTKRLVAALDGAVAVTPALTLRARASRNVATPRISDLPDGPADTSGFFGYVSDATVTRDLIDLRAELTRGGQRLTLAVERSEDQEDSRNVTLSSFGDFPGDFAAQRRNVGVTAQWLGNLGTRTALQLGARHDENSAFGGFTTGRLALAHQLTASTGLRASLGNAFKAPTFFENFATGFVTGDPALRPERSTTAELGLQQGLAGGRAMVAATVFVQRYRDIVQYAATVPEGAPNYANLAEARADGLELEGQWRLAAAWQLRGSYTWLDTEVLDAGADEGAAATFVDGDRLLRRPTHLAVAGLRWTPRWGSLDLSATRTGARDDRDFRTFPAEPVTLPAYTRVDLAVTHALPRGPWRTPLTLEARAENLLNAYFEGVANFRAPGRTLYAGLRIGQ